MASFVVGFGNAFRHRTSNWARWGRTKLGPRAIKEAISIQTTSSNPDVVFSSSFEKLRGHIKNLGGNVVGDVEGPLWNECQLGPRGHKHDPKRETKLQKRRLV